MIETIDKDNLIGIVTMVDCLRYTVQELQDDFFEKFPYAKKLSDGTPEVCAAKVGYLRECPHPNVEDYCKECWNTALEE